MGRPTLYTPELGEEICERMTTPRSLRSICRDDEDMPAMSAIFRWLIDEERFQEQYRRAREMMADALAEESLEIADDGSNDWMERRSEAEKGAGVMTGWVVNGEHVNRSRLRVDTRKWFASKIAPKKYGEKVQLAGDADNPIKHEHDVAVRPQLTREQWLKLHSGDK